MVYILNNCLNAIALLILGQKLSIDSLVNRPKDFAWNVVWNTVAFKLPATSIWIQSFHVAYKHFIGHLLLTFSDTTAESFVQVIVTQLEHDLGCRLYLVRS